MKFRYDECDGRWFKGNTHLHSTASDGGKTFAELAAMYAGAGYDFLFRTDHWVCSDVAADPAAYPLLWLDGIELHGEDHSGQMFHVVALGQVRDVRQDQGVVAAMEACRAQGALMILAHPQWCGNAAADAWRYGFHGIEIYNHVCQWMNGKGSGLHYWEHVLAAGRDVLALAVDDAHMLPEHPGWNGGWLMVQAPALGRPALLDAIRAGRYYASCGPLFHHIAAHGRHVRLETSPVRFARLCGLAWRGTPQGYHAAGRTLTTAEFDVPADWAQAWIEIEDAHGRRAWTNTLFS